MSSKTDCKHLHTTSKIGRVEEGKCAFSMFLICLDCGHKKAIGGTFPRHEWELKPGARQYTCKVCGAVK